MTRQTRTQQTRRSNSPWPGRTRPCSSSGTPLSPRNSADAILTETTTTRQVLEFKEKPDYEDPTDANKDNVYQVTVQVFDGEDTTTKDVTVKVTNKQEDGEVEVTPLQARIGIELTAELTDSDIVAYGPMWQWQKSGATCTDHAALIDERLE